MKDNFNTCFAQACSKDDGKRLFVMDNPYEKMTGKFFVDFMKDNFNTCFAQACSKDEGKRLFVMDNDLCQSGKVAMNALEGIEAELLKIPALNPIENIFHIVKCDLC